MTTMRQVVVAAGVAVIAFTTFHVPAILTGRVLVSDAPTPPGWTGVVGDAEFWIHRDLDGFYGLRLAGLVCNGTIASVYFDVLGPFAPATALVASSEDPWDGSDPGWEVQLLAPTPDHPDAASFMAAHARPCGI